MAGNIDKSNLRLVAEQPDIWKVKINDTSVSSDSQQSWLDPRFGVYEIGELVETGVNVVELSVEPMSIYAEIAPIYILGDFALQSASARWIIIEPAENLGLGSWKTQGHPYYSWDVSYSKSYTIKDLSAQYTLQLKEWNGTLSEVYVNGSKVGLIAYKPYEFDLSPYLKRAKIILRSEWLAVLKTYWVLIITKIKA